MQRPRTMFRLTELTLYDVTAMGDVFFRQLEARLIEERADLVASNGLLDQNERLRAVIVAEEREKFQSEKVCPLLLGSCFYFVPWRWC